MFLINIHQNVPVSIWYDWKNDGPDPNEREHNFGTVKGDLTPKTAYLAAKTLSTTLAGFSFERCLYLGPDKDFGCLLKKDNIEALALWTTGDEHELTLQLKAGRGILVDMLGNKKEISWNEQGLKLTVSQSPQYLLLSSK